MRSIIKERIQDILAVVLWDEYFDSAPNKQFLAVDAAIASVLHDHAVAVGGEHNGSSYFEAHMKQALEYLAKKLSRLCSYISGTRTRR